MMHSIEYRLRRSILLASLLGMGSLVVSTHAAAQTAWPSQPIRFIVPYPVGGGVDKAARLVSDRLAKALGQPVVVDNRGGAAGNIGSDIAAKSPADGYTIMMGASALAVNPSLYNKLSYDPVKDFVAITLIARTPNIVTVNPKVPAKTIKELIALAKSKPGELNYASAGAGTTPHLDTELFDSMAGVKMTHVPYKGTSFAVTAILSGEVDVFISPALTVLQHVRNGKLRALGVTSLERSASFPDIPTVAESGLPGFETAQWYGIFAPTGTPKPIVDRIAKEVAAILKAPEVKESLDSDGSIAGGDTPEDFDRFFKSEVARWQKVIRPEDRLN